jgi:hypothetical protein
MKTQSLGIIAVISTLGLVTGCGSSRDVALSGTVTADSAISGGPVRLEVYEHQQSSDSNATTDLKFVDAVALDNLGKFDKTVPIEGDKIHVFAFIDANKDEKCTDGEAWGESEAAIQKDDTATVSLNIVAESKCPALPAAN